MSYRFDPTSLFFDPAHQLAEKATPDPADVVAIEDSADSYARKHVRIDSLVPTLSIKEVTTTPYDVQVDDSVLLVNLPVPGEATINLPSGAEHRTKMLYIKDKAGIASSFNITLVPNPVAGDDVDGDVDYVLDNDYEAVTLAFYGTTWSVL